MVALAAAVVVVLGVYVFAGELAPGGERGSMAVIALWFVVAVAAGFLIQRRVRFLREWSTSRSPWPGTWPPPRPGPRRLGTRPPGRPMQHPHARRHPQ